MARKGEMRFAVKRAGDAAMGTFSSATISSKTHARNERIRTLYAKGKNTTDLSEKFGLSRERVCQILRSTNSIEIRRARRKAAAEEASQWILSERERITKERDDKIAVAITLVKKGYSQRKACVAVGMPPHSRFASILRERFRLLGIPNRHGRWARDFRDRSKKVEALIKEGRSIVEILRTLRPIDATLSAPWISNFLAQRPDLQSIRVDGRYLRKGEIRKSSGEYARKRAMLAEIGKRIVEEAGVQI